jgi:hypothetical protein
MLLVISLENTVHEGTQIVNFCEALTHVNIIILDIPHIYDLIETFCVNHEIQVFNRKLRKVTKLYKHVKVLVVSSNRKVFTRHGLHLNGEGKMLMARQIVREIRQITVEEINNMISLDWKGKIGRNFADSRCDKLEVQGNHLPTYSRTDGEQGHRCSEILHQNKNASSK